SMSRLIITAQRPHEQRLLRITSVSGVLIALLFLIKLALTLVERSSEAVSDLAAFYEGAARLRSGLPLYETGVDFYAKPIQYIYPPPIALLLLPLPDYLTTWWVWALISLLCWAGALALLLRELSGDLRERVPPIWWPLLLGELVAFTPVLSHFFWGQTQLQLLLLLTVSWMFLRRGRDVPAGLVLGIAIAVKIFPLLLFAPLLARRRWRCLAAATLSAGLILIGSYAAVGWDQAYVFFTDVLPRHSGSVIAHSTNHTTIAAMLTNAFGSALLAYYISMAMRGLVMLAVLYGAWRARDTAQAFALGMTTLVLVTPVVWEHYFVLVYLPWLDALARSNRRQQPLLVVSYFLFAAAMLIYHVPSSVLWLAQLLPISGGFLLLGIQLQQAIEPVRLEAVVAEGG
ncbi:MAG TPA: glycosyltransferase family 87 protein, partial [Roseiflexaceae bacterium]|nr:glycosyltransferase family 87 protein [Roseiflexaceae bacterium]